MNDKMKTENEFRRAWHEAQVADDFIRIVEVEEAWNQWRKSRRRRAAIGSRRRPRAAARPMFYRRRMNAEQAKAEARLRVTVPDEG